MPHRHRQPSDSLEALTLLKDGNLSFCSLFQNTDSTGVPVMSLHPEDFGVSANDASVFQQAPFSAVLGCADARVPTELVFHQTCNNLFVVRVAGNVLSNEGLGSLDYAVETFPRSLRLVTVLGHTHCGAVTAAVDAFLDPKRYLQLASSHHLRSILDRLFIAVRAAAQSLHQCYGSQINQAPGYRAGLIQLSVIINTLLTAYTLNQEYLPKHPDGLRVAYGIYDLQTQKVEAYAKPSSDPWCLAQGLAFAPDNGEVFTALQQVATQSQALQTLLLPKDPPVGSPPASK